MSVLWLRLLKLSGVFEYHRLGNFFNLGCSKEFFCSTMT